MSISRRDAVRRLGMAAAGTAGAGALARVAAACATEDRSPPAETLGPLGVQLYTVRAAMRDSVEETLARVARIGYRQVEFAGYFDRTPAQIAAALRDNGLTAPSAHVDARALEGDAAAATIEAAHAIGHQYLVVAWMPAEWRRTLDDWRRIGDRFNRIGETCRAAGIQFAYHNHDFEFAPMDGRVPFDVFCEGTDRSLVQIELDLYWITHGGGDPLAFFGRWPGRIPMVHVKDRTADAHMVDVGAGVIDWRTIFRQRRAAGIRHYFVEHDEPADPFASIEASFGYLSRLEV